MDDIKFILEIFGLVPTDIPKYTFFIIIFGLMIWVIFKRQFSPFKKAIKNIETFCTRLSTFLTSRDEIPTGSPEFNPALEISSPIKLKSIAYSILKDSGADKIVKNNKNCLYETMKTFGELRTALDVQRGARKTLIISQNRLIFDKVKLFTYQYPKYKTKEGEKFIVNFEFMLDVMSIRLRDLYLEEHPEIPRKWVPERGETLENQNRQALDFGDSNKALTREENKELYKSKKEE